MVFPVVNTFLSVSRQAQDLADAKQQPEGSQSASAVPEVKAHSQALALPLKAEPQLQKVEVTVQAQTDQHASARQALPPTMHLHQQELVVHSPQKPNMLRLQPQPISVASAQAPMSTPAEVAVQNAAQASQSNAAPASGNQDPDVPHCEAPHAQSPIPHDQEMLEAAVKQTGLELASHMEAANSAVPTVLAECLASNNGLHPFLMYYSLHWMTFPSQHCYTVCKSCPALGFHPASILSITKISLSSALPGSRGMHRFPSWECPMLLP